MIRVNQEKAKKALSDAIADVWYEIRDCDKIESLGALWLAWGAVYDESAMQDAISLNLYKDEHWTKVHTSSVNVPRPFLKAFQKLVMEAIARNICNGNKVAAKRILAAYRSSHA